MIPSKLETLTGAALMSMPLPPTRMIVESLVPQGLHILGGAPKIGKSWLTLWLCLRIAQGEPVWDLPTEKGDTLYLCLEDSFARVQNRLLDFTEDAPDTIHFATMSETIAGGLVKQIETFLADHPQTNFIAIDTLQRVRDATGEANDHACSRGAGRRRRGHDQAPARLLRRGSQAHQWTDNIRQGLATPEGRRVNDLQYPVHHNGTDNILMPITNVINSLYAKDCSRKTKAAHRARAQAGKFLGSRAPFGYMKDPDDRHHLIIDPPAAEVVQHIFLMFADGVGYVHMTKILREENILNPQAYFNQNNPDYYKNDYWRQPFDWHATSVRAILNNPVYLGKTVFGRTKTKGIYQKDRVHTEEEDWIVVNGTHEALVTQDTWDLVHKMMESRRRECRNGEIQMFAGLIKCGGCGTALNASYDAKKGKFRNFSCWGYKNYGKERCTSHAIGWQAMQTIVLNDIRRNAQIAVDHAEEYLQMLTSAHTDKQKKETEKNKRALKVAEKRIAELDRIIAKLYADSALGKVPEARAQTMMTTYEQEQQELSLKRDALQFEISQAEEAYDNAENFIYLIAKYLYVEELNAAILNELIEKIVVHEKEIDWNGKKVQRVDIHYRFVGYLPIPNVLEGFGRVEAGSLQELWKMTERNIMAAQREFVKV